MEAVEVPLSAAKAGGENRTPAGRSNKTSTKLKRGVT
jgi:hypothetical protein